MHGANDPHREAAEKLRDRIRMSLVLDDAMVSQLDLAARTLAEHGDSEGARTLREAARRHRVGVIKHRAIMSARGIDV